MPSWCLILHLTFKLCYLMISVFEFLLYIYRPYVFPRVFWFFFFSLFSPFLALGIIYSYLLHIFLMVDCIFFYLIYVLFALIFHIFRKTSLCDYETLLEFQL